MRALGYTEEQILETFYNTETVDLSQAKLETEPDERLFFKGVDPAVTLNQRPTGEILDNHRLVASHDLLEGRTFSPGRGADESGIRRRPRPGAVVIDHLRATGHASIE